MSKTNPLLPFSIDRSQPVRLVEQISQGISSSLSSGYFKAGDRLPNLEEMAEELQVGLHTVRHAILALVEKGELSMRRREGIRVLPRDQHTFTRHILHLRFGGSGFYFSTKDLCYHERLFDERVRVSSVLIWAGEFEAGLPHVRTALACNPIDLVVIDGPSGGLLDLLREHGVPYLCAGDRGNVAKALGNFSYDNVTPLKALGQHLVDNGVRTLGLLGMHPINPDFLNAFAALGLEVEAMPMERRQDTRSPEDVERAGYEGMRDRLGRPEPLPQALYIGDDYATRGALTAALEAGLSIPRDLQLTAMVNRGFRPIFSRELTRLEQRPREHGQLLADLTVRILRGASKAGETVTVSPVLIIGDTTISI